ncbi:SH3 domain-binding protein 5 homolog isoform X1 [Daphnia magna]|uniref:SH3 domain-binding protein n=2 Tax=Daphnia magna TaxID=35525 RepID=A0A0P5LPS7_9CRUS|nr:SH3 domain-binding protein 5 homolog isoform X1 [Daphnia magna]KZS14508.1 SH3 domain-binding protein 5 protein [Daphnia magna]
MFRSSPAVVGDDEELDPRIQVELEKLNSTTDEINRWEAELDEANAGFRTLLSRSTQQLKALAKKLGSCIEKSRPYYDAFEEYKTAQERCQEAAVQFQRAFGIHKAAKETIALAEQRFLSHQHEWKFDNAWQEMLNQATMRVMEAETQRQLSEKEHQRSAAVFEAAKQKYQYLEKDLKSAIQKSRPYFEQKEDFQNKLMAQKLKVELIQQSVTQAKQIYSDTLKNLECISEEIHERRLLSRPREPGVGAEKNCSPPPSLNFDLDQCDIVSLVSNCTLNRASDDEEFSCSSTPNGASSN